MLSKSKLIAQPMDQDGEGLRREVMGNECD